MAKIGLLKESRIIMLMRGVVEVYMDSFFFFKIKLMVTKKTKDIPSSFLIIIVFLIFQKRIRFLDYPNCVP